MKTNIELLKIKGITTPDFSEPKGDEFKKVVDEIHYKVEKKRVIRSNSVNEVKELNTELARLKNKALMSEDEFEEIEIREQIKKIQEELERTEDYSDFDVNLFARKMIGKDEIKDLQEKARAEHIENVKSIKEYKEELDKQYELATREINRFIADYRSDSTYAQASVRYNRYKGSN